MESNTNNSNVEVQEQQQEAVAAATTEMVDTRSEETKRLEQLE